LADKLKIKMTAEDLINDFFQIHRDNPNGAIYMYSIIAFSLIAYRLKNRYGWAKNLWNLFMTFYILLGIKLSIGKFKK
jgi:hypothetical protein